MRFSPKTEEELAIESAIEPGVYDFEILRADEKQSKSGNQMIELLLKVFTNAGERTIFDYLLESMAFKLRHFCDSTGLLTSYEEGTLTAAQCVGKVGKVRIAIERKGDFAGKNKVQDYIKREEFWPRESTIAQMRAPALKDDNIPF